MTKAKRTMILAMVLILILTALPMTALAAGKKPKTGMWTDGKGYTYIYKNGKLQTGWITYKGNRYYAHKTKGAAPKGSLTKDAVRVKNGHMYYFDSNGKKITKTTRTLYAQYEVKGHGSTKVLYIYKTRGSRRGQTRYNCEKRRYEYKTGGKWKTLEKGWWSGIDWQK